MSDPDAPVFHYMGPEVEPYSSHLADVLLIIRESINGMILAGLTEVDVDFAPREYRLTIKAKRGRT